MAVTLSRMDTALELPVFACSVASGQYTYIFPCALGVGVKVFHLHPSMVQHVSENECEGAG